MIGHLVVSFEEVMCRIFFPSPKLLCEDDFIVTQVLLGIVFFHFWENKQTKNPNKLVEEAGLNFFPADSSDKHSSFCALRDLILT